MKDLLLEKFFEGSRWEYAIEKGIFKDISQSQLYQLTKKEIRIKMLHAISSGKYEIAPPHTAQIPKDNPGEFRTVYINEPIDRIFLSIANDLLFELTPEMIHPSCKSYLKGTGCGMVVQSISKRIENAKGETIGFKSDLSKYFDSVPVRYIDMAFDAVESKYGHSSIIDVLRKYYHSDFYFDENGELVENYQSLKQGCSVASWLADVIIYHIDKQLSEIGGDYIRYCDDMIFVGKDYEKAMSVLSSELEKMEMKLNPKKVEYLSSREWFKFLGYSIKGINISISQKRLKTFQKEIMDRTISSDSKNWKDDLTKVIRYLYKGDGKHSWASQILPICNVKRDILELDKFVMDCLRAKMTGKKKVGGLGYSKTLKCGCVIRGKGRNVKANREKTPATIEGYRTLACMQNAIKTDKALYTTLVNGL